MSPSRFYWLAVLALASAGFFVVQSASGSTDRTNTLGTWVFAFLAILSIGVGNAFWVVNRRLRELERTRGTPDA